MFFRLLPSTKDPRDQPPYLFRWRSSEAYILTTVAMGIFTDIFLYAVLVPVFPFALEFRANIAVENVQSWTSILLGVFASGLLTFAPVWGWVADHTKSRTIPFSAGLICLIATTILLCLATSIVGIIVGRLLQGISSALVWSVGLAIVSDTVGPKRVGEAMGWVTLGMVTAMFLGPMLGGIAFEKGGYYSVFAMCFALLSVDCFLRLTMIEKKLAKHYAPNDTLPTADSDENEKDLNVKGLASPIQLDAAQETAQIQHIKPRRFSILYLVKIPRLIAAFYACLVHAIMLSSFDAVLPLFVRGTFGWDSLGAGLIFFAICIPSLFEPVIGKFADRFGPRYLASAGLLFTTPSWVLLRFVTHNSIEQKVLLCALLALLGFTISLILPPMMGEITRVVIEIEEQQPGLFGSKGAFAQAYALFNMAYAAGMLAGPLWAGYVVEGTGWGTYGWSFAILGAVSSIPVFLYAGGELWKKKNSKSNLARGDEEIAD